MIAQKEKQEARELIAQIAASTTPFHAVEYVKKTLAEDGFVQLSLSDCWKLTPGGKYMVPVFDRTLVAFSLGEKKADHQNIRIAAAHTDFPCFKVKPLPEINAFGCHKLNVEPYGGMIRSAWMDRPLSLAGKVILKGVDPFIPQTLLVDWKRPVLTIPNLAIHMNRNVNDGVCLDPQKDMLPLCDLAGQETDEHYFLCELAKVAGCRAEDILEYEIYLYQQEEGTLVGFDETLISSPRLDNITSVRACMEGLKNGRRKEGINLIALFDNEEVGSQTKQGAASNLVPFILERIYLALGDTREQMLADLSDGFFLSADVAHAVHPNCPEKADPTNRPFLGSGVTFKMAASQSYASDCEAAAIARSLCERAGIPYCRFVNHSSIRGGGTLGSIASTALVMKTMDVGVPILAMHSARELMGAGDQCALNALVTEVFS